MVTRRRYLRALGMGALVTGAGCSGPEGTLGTEFGIVTESATLLPEDPPQSFGRGTAVADDATTVLVGAPGTESSTGAGYGDMGAVYVFTRQDDGWDEQAVLAREEGDADRTFGVSIALSDGGTAMVGSVSDEPDESSSGVAYVFENRDGDEWTRRAALTPADGDDVDSFGGLVTLDRAGTTAVVAATRDGSGSESPGVSFAVFSEDRTGWTRTATLELADSVAMDPSTVDIAFAGDGSTVLVGGQVDDSSGENVGAVYVFEADDGTWRRETRLVPDDREELDFFGTSVSLSADGSRALVGASGDAGSNGGNSSLIGSVYVFAREADGWTRRTKLRAPRGRFNDLFGEVVAMGARGRQAVVGAPGSPVDGVPTAGEAYRYVEQDGNWVLAAKLAANEPEQGQFLGQTVALDAVTVILGTLNLTDYGPNSVYVYGP